uniref:Cytochrome P450 2K1-like n=1 Tax=Sphaeramia orbicularis TaxID=375764 RepID=A0A673CFA7_9TELE
MSKKYGPVFTVYLGPKKVVVLAGYKTVKEALVNQADEFGERDSLAIVNDTYRVLWSNGESWKEMRRFTLTNLRDYGMGKKACEDKIIEECQYLIEVFKEFKDQVQEEISRVIGTRQVQVEDRKNLPFTDAVIHETQRLANIVPMALPHKTSEDVTFQGYFIKKGTTVYPLLTSVLYDESEWEKPYSFNPAHFLDKDGKFVKRDAFMPFSAGRRICLGESLARMELFLFFTSILQHFRFTPPPGVKEEDLDLTPQVGFTLSPSLHKICAVCRM